MGVLHLPSLLMGSSRDFILLTMCGCHSQQLPALAGGLGTGGHGQKLLPKAVAAEVVRLAIAFGVQSGGFVHRHSANRVFGHRFRFFHGHVSFLVLFVTVL